MTPLAILLLMSTGLIGSALIAGSNESDVADAPPQDDDEGGHDFSHGDLVSDALKPIPNDTTGSDPSQGGVPDDEMALSSSGASQEGREIRGSEGNDILEVSAAQGEAGNTFRGEDGRDFIRTSAVSGDEGYTSRDLFNSHLGGGGNTVYGGRGDDVMEISRDDVVEGGEGHDVFVVMADPDNGGSYEPATVRDLQAGDDIIVVNLPHASPGEAPLHERVEQRVDGEDTIILVNGAPTLRIVGQTDIDVGTQDDPDAPFSISNLAAITDAGHLALTGLDGSAISGPLPQVILRYYTEVS